MKGEMWRRKRRWKQGVAIWRRCKTVRRKYKSEIVIVMYQTDEFLGPIF
jgi:hypothetical protein